VKVSWEEVISLSPWRVLIRRERSFGNLRTLK
jgi:hypothetical protein